MSAASKPSRQQDHRRRLQRSRLQFFEAVAAARRRVVKLKAVLRRLRRRKEEGLLADGQRRLEQLLVEEWETPIHSQHHQDLLSPTAPAEVQAIITGCNKRYHSCESELFVRPPWTTTTTMRWWTSHTRSPGKHQRLRWPSQEGMRHRHGQGRLCSILANPAWARST